MSKALRQRLLARIHCARKELGLDEDAYRDVVERVGKVRSASELDDKGLHRLADELRRLGATSPRKSYPGRPHNTDSDPQLQKVEALLTEQSLPWAYADGIAKQMFQVDRLAFCDATQLRAVITALIKRGEK